MNRPGMYYDMDGNEITSKEWIPLLGDDTREVGNDRVGDIVVSTVYLGLNHNFDDGPPLIFETMIFGGEHDQWMDRYSTREEALAGHAYALSMVGG